MGFPKYLKNLHTDIINYYQGAPSTGGFENSKFWKKFGHRDYQYMWNYQIHLLARYSQLEKLQEIKSLNDSILDKNPYSIQKECYRIVLKCLYNYYDRKFNRSSNERVNFKWFIKIDYSNDKPIPRYLWIKINPRNYEKVKEINSYREEKSQKIK